MTVMWKMFFVTCVMEVFTIFFSNIIIRNVGTSKALHYYLKDDPQNVNPEIIFLTKLMNKICSYFPDQI